MKLILSYLSGFTAACILFYLFGGLSIQHYPYFLAPALEMLAIPFLVNGLVRKQRPETQNG